MRETDSIISKINPEFYSIASIVIKTGDEYYSYVKSSKIAFKTSEQCVHNDLSSATRKVIVVNEKGRVIQTNLDLCDECGEPIMNFKFGVYCSLECMSCN